MKCTDWVCTASGIERIKLKKAVQIIARKLQLHKLRL